jgi:hypothetical protein
MGDYNLAYKLFHILIFVFVVIMYAILVYYIIPTFVQEDKRQLASTYSTYALTVVISLLTLGSMITEYIDTRIKMNSQTIKAGRR